MDPPKFDPKFARDVIDPRRASRSTPREIPLTWIAPPKVQPKFAREFVGPSPGAAAQSRQSRRSAEPQGRPQDDGFSRASDPTKHSVDLESLLRLSPVEFEKLIVYLLQLCEIPVKVTPLTRDGGLDGVLIYNGVKIGLELKRYKGTVNTDAIHKLLGALVTSRLKYGIFITTGKFSPNAMTLAAAHRITLIDGAKLVENLADLRAVLPRAG